MSSPYHLRFFPAPSGAQKVSVERTSLPTLITMSDLSTAAEISLMESQVVATLLPLIKDFIAASPIASPSMNVGKVEAIAARVRETLPYTRNPTVTAIDHGTPPGY